MLKVDRPKFFTEYRDKFGGLTQGVVDGLNSLLDNFEKEERVASLEQYAYILASAYHETGWPPTERFQPIYEKISKESAERNYGSGSRVGKKLGNTGSGDGFRYRGRGYVQITGRRNYKVLGDLVGKDLVNTPDLALDPGVAYNVMIEGMIRGLFTGVALDRYVNNHGCDYVNARRVINGVDKAELIARYARFFQSILRDSQTA